MLASPCSYGLDTLASGLRHDIYLLRPKTIFIVIPNRFQFCGSWLSSRDHAVSNAQPPTGIGQHVIQLDTGMKRSQVRLAVVCKTALVVITADGPPRGSPTRFRQPRPSPFPGLVMYETRSGKRCLRCSSSTTKRCAREAISQAPPEPGRRTTPFGPRTSVEFKFPKRSTSAAPRNPKCTRPDCSKLMTPSMSRHCVAPRMLAGSAMV